MADIFDEISTETAAPARDVFDELETEQVQRPQYPALPPGAGLTDFLSQPGISFSPQTGVVRSALPGVLQPEDLLPAVRKIGGELAIGEKGDTHPDIIERDDIPAVEIDQRGFAGPGGLFFPREPAAEALQAPTEFEPGRLHSPDLEKAQEAPKPLAPPDIALSPYEKADIESMRKGLGKTLTGMEPGTELTSAIGEAVKETAPKAWDFARKQAEIATLPDPLRTAAQMFPKEYEDAKAEIQTGLRPVGSTLHQLGKDVRDSVAAAAFLAVGEPALSKQQLGIGLEPGEPTPIEQGMKQLPGAARLASQAAYGLTETAPQFAAVIGLQRLGVPSTISAPIIFGLTPEGFDATQAAVIAGIPFVGRAGEQLVVKALSDAPIVKVALERVKDTGALRGKVTQKLAGVEISSDQLRQFMEAGGNFAAVNAYLLAASTPQILALPADQRKDAILDAVANNIAPSLLAFVRKGDMSQSLANIGRKLAPELESFLREVSKPPRYTPTGRQLPEGGIEPPAAGPRVPPLLPPAPSPAPAAPAAPTAEAVMAPADIAKQLGIEAGGASMGFQLYTFKHPNGIERITVPEGSGIDVVRQKMQETLKRFEGEPGTLPTAEDIFKASDEVFKGMIESKQGEALTAKLAAEMTEEQLKQAEPILKAYLQRHADAKTAVDTGEITPQQYVDIVMERGTKGKVFADVFARLKRPMPTIEPTPAAPEKETPRQFSYTDDKGTTFTRTITRDPQDPTKWRVSEFEKFKDDPATVATGHRVFDTWEQAYQSVKERVGETEIPPIQKPPVLTTKPAAPKTAPAKPVALHPDVQKMLKPEIPDVTEAKVRDRALTAKQDALQKEYGTLDQQIRELEKRILGTRGYSRGKIRSGTTAADRKQYDALKKQRSDLFAQINLLRDTNRADRDAIEHAETLKIIADEKQPLIRRLDRLYRLHPGDEPLLAKALSEETYRLIRLQYPDATDAELERLAPQVQRAAYFSAREEDIWKDPQLPKLQNLRQGELEAALNNPDVVSWEYLSSDIKDRINRYTPAHRAYQPEPKPIEELSRKELDSLKRDLIAESNRVRAEIAAKEDARVKAEAEAEAQEEKLLAQAQEVADSAGKPGTPGGRSAKAVRDDLVDRTKQAIDRVIQHDKTEIKTDWERTKDDPDKLTHYIAEGKESGSVATGETGETEGGKIEVTARSLKDPKNPFKATVTTVEEAKWIIKAMASSAPGKAIFGVPGDGVWRLLRYGPTMLGAWRDAKRIDVSSGKAIGISRGEKVEKPPTEVRTAKQWEYAKEWHGISSTDTIWDWSPALRKLAEHLLPQAPERVTAHMVDVFIRTGVKPTLETAPAAPVAPKPVGESAKIQALRRQADAIQAAIDRDKDAPRLTELQGRRLTKLNQIKAQIERELAAKPKPEAKPAAPAPKPAEAPAEPGKLIPKDRADKIRERLKKRLSEKPKEPEAEMALEDVEPEALEARSPKADPQLFSDAVQMGAYYIQSGLHKFEPWAAQMRSDFGEAIEPYLKSVYETARITIESPRGETVGEGRKAGLQPGLLPPESRIVHARGEQTGKADESILPPENVKHLDPHQKQGAATNIASLEARGGGLNADGTGVGKTREGLTVAHYWAKKGFKVIYVTKAEAIKPNWKKGTFGGSLFNDAKTMGVNIRLDKHAHANPGEIVVTTYENASSVESRADAQTVIIWDESHALKNNSARGRAGDRANAKAHSVLFMSATPADKPEHIYYLTRIGIMEGKTTAEQLRDLGMVEVEVPYIDKKTGERKKHKIWAPNQNISQEERDARFKALFDRMTEKGAMIKREISMQGVHVQVLKVALPAEAHDLQQEILRFFDAETIDDLKGLNKALALMNMRRQQEPFKIAPAVLLTQRELEAGRQVMIFVSRVNESDVGRWIKVRGPGGETERIRQVLMSSEGTAKQLRAALHEAGIHDIAEIHGESDQEGLAALADFNDGKKRVCIATIESGGTGINADDTVGNRPRTMIVMTAPFDAVGNVQAAGRIWRLKTMSGANIFYLFADTDVDDWNADIIGSKMATLGAVVEGQVRRLDISNPDAVTTDDFQGKVKKAAPTAAGGMPVLKWEPITSKAGNPMFRAEATGPFWTWWKTGGRSQAKALGIATIPDKASGKWYVWARKLPAEAPAAAPAPPATDPTVGPGNETAEEMRHNTPTGLPPGVNDGGPDFARELLAASHKLGTTVRSRVTLPPGVLGRYVPARAAITRDDKIEVGDIQNQLTVAHEMGHDVDALLFPVIFVQNNHRHSQASLAERLGLPSKDKKKLFQELVPVSELMRGPIIGTVGHQQYRRRATELIADWFALYVHDPAKAQAMAPTWTAGFESKLRGDPVAWTTVQELHARNVEPAAPAPPAPPTGPPTGMPGAVPPRPEPPFVPRETNLMAAAETLVKGTIRRAEAEVQKARVKAENWRDKVPDKQDRNDVGAFVEGIGNLEIPGDTRDAVVSRMTPAKKFLAKEYAFQVELQRQRINAFLNGYEEGEYLKWLEDYLPHFYVNAKTPAGKQAISRFLKTSPNAKQRKIPTLREAVEYGLIPITQDPTILYELHARINWRVATNRAFLAQLKRMRTSAGEPVVVPASQNTMGWPVSNNPLIQRVYARKTPQGIMLWRGGAAIHPDIWPAVRQILETTDSTELGKAYDIINSVLRANAFAFSFFHDLTLRSASLGAEAELTNPLRGLFRIFERDPVSGELRVLQETRVAGKELLRDEDTVADAALHGLRFAWTDTEAYQHAARDILEQLAVRLRDVPFLGKSARMARDVQHWRQLGLWRNTHDAFKILAYHDLVAKALKTAPAGTDPKLVKETIASLLNDAFGGQEWQTKFWMSPKIRQVLARFWLAPDWTLSTLRSVPLLSDVASETRGQAARISGRGPEPTPKEGWRGNIGRARFWVAELAALALATLAAQWAIYRLFGKDDKGDKPWVWENEAGQNRRIDVTPLMRKMPWRDENDPTRYYVNLGKRPEEILTWLVDPFRNVQSKMARPLIEAIRQLTGMEGDFKAEWKREHETFLESIPERLKSLGREALPFTFSGNQFALSLPYRKGMSKYKAQEAFESAYELIAEPSRLKATLRGNFSNNMDRLLEDIRDAAYRNGVPADAVERRARSTIRGYHYHNYFRAFQKGDQKAIEKEADALMRLGVGGSDIAKDIERRLKLEPR